jgi:succinate dehydrogenase / fumarate reductase cytochrome b subunit
MAAGERPLSPHLQVWRWHVTMLASILHRASGLALHAGAILFVLWLFAIAAGPETYAPVGRFLEGPLGQLGLFGLTTALAYHLGSGLRHLVWDAGYGYQVKFADLTGWIVLAFALAAPVGLWLLANGGAP